MHYCDARIQTQDIALRVFPLYHSAIELFMTRKDILFFYFKSGRAFYRGSGKAISPTTVNMCSRIPTQEADFSAHHGEATTLRITWPRGLLQSRPRRDLVLNQFIWGIL